MIDRTFPPTKASWSRLLDCVEQALNWNSAGQIQIEKNTGSMSLTFVPPEKFRAKITENYGDGSYAWELVDELPDGQFETTPDGNDAATGDYNLALAWESNGNKQVPVDTIVTIRFHVFNPATAEAEYDFDYCCETLVVEITGGTQPYSWREMQAAMDGQYEPVTNGQYGSLTENEAYERNGNQQIQPGFLALLYRGYSEDTGEQQEWIFDADGPIPAKITSKTGASTTLSGAISASQTTMSVPLITDFPITNGFLIRLGDDEEESEVAKVTDGAGTANWTIERGIDDTTAEAHADGTTVTHLAYSWEEQRADPNGQWGDHPTARSGSPTDQPAYERNNNTRVAVDTFVLLFRHHYEARTTIVAAITSEATSLQINDKHGFPTVDNFIIQIDDEKLEVVSGANTETWTVTRGVSGTLAATHAIEAVVKLIEKTGAGPAHFQQWVFDRCCSEDESNPTSPNKKSETTSGTKNEYSVPKRTEWVMITTTTTTTINGINRNSVENKRFQLSNNVASTDPITVNHQSASATEADYQIDTPSSRPFSIYPGETYVFKHDTGGTNRWYVERSSQLPQVGSGVPSHTARPGTEYVNIDTEIVYVNTDGSTNWEPINTGDGTGDRLNLLTYPTVEVSGFTVLDETSIGAKVLATADADIFLADQNLYPDWHTEVAMSMAVTLVTIYATDILCVDGLIDERTYGPGDTVEFQAEDVNWRTVTETRLANFKRLTVEEADASPSVNPTTVLQFSSDFTVTDMGSETALVEFAGTPGSLTVREVDGSPSVSPTTILEFGAGFTVTDEGGDTARVTMTVSPTSKSMLLMGG